MRRDPALDRARAPRALAPSHAPQACPGHGRARDRDPAGRDRLVLQARLPGRLGPARGGPAHVVTARARLGLSPEPAIMFRFTSSLSKLSSLDCCFGTTVVTGSPSPSMCRTRPRTHPLRALLGQRRDDDLVEVALRDRARDGLEGVRSADERVDRPARGALEQRDGELQRPVRRLAAGGVGDQQGEGRPRRRAPVARPRPGAEGWRTSGSRRSRTRVGREVSIGASDQCATSTTRAPSLARSSRLREAGQPSGV